MHISRRNIKLILGTNKKNIFFGLLSIIIILIFVGFSILSSFSLFNDEIKQLEKFDIPGKNYSIKIYLVPSNATVQSAIQVRKMENGTEEVIANYERFNNLNNYGMKNDTLILYINNNSIPKSETEMAKIKLP